ncbi:polysaccharide deacetylase family protein [Xanthomarina spongicola]|uniref:Polysaccharide deacetylase n=1 Tax=Xanthomarina spongicola TaxID=570520 RepID=A0A316DP29_9FLAO|nr:polysaccharide deacetylase family protein [Xanthomarina spongicola]PWK19967.1 polysaccharide deacetylase [Xanthomarina spongicola]
MILKTTGYFIFSLDFELHWGMIDKVDVSQYEENLKNVKLVIPRLLELANTYNIKLTFATVGFLFAKDKNELLYYKPKQLPTYKDKKFDPYSKIDSIGNNEQEDGFHYASNLIDEISKSQKHEISTHTYSHYYCLEDGQTKEQFEADLLAARAIALKKNIEINSIVFPRNQVNNNLLETCYKNGINCYRGTENNPIYNTGNKKIHGNIIAKGLRVADSFINLTGHHTYKIENQRKEAQIINIPSSRFLRPYSSTLKLFDPLRISRVKSAMTHAAKNNEVYHLWNHPHNLGKNIDENFKALESIFDHYNNLNKKYNFRSMTMKELAKNYSNINETLL